MCKIPCFFTKFHKNLKFIRFRALKRHINSYISNNNQYIALFLPKNHRRVSDKRVGYFIFVP